MRALCVALLVHAAALLALPTVTPRTRFGDSEAPLVVEITASRARSLPVIASVQAPKAPKAPARSLSSAHPLEAATSAEPIGPPVEPSPAEPPSGPKEPATEPAHVELFPRATLDGIAGPPRASWGGTTRNGHSPPAAAEDAGAAAKRAIDGFARGVQGELDAQQGRVDPVWRDLERGIDRAFHPSASQITDENRVTSLAHQLLRALRTPPTGGLTPRGVDPSRTAELGTFIPDQLAASRRTLSEPAEWRHVEIVVTVDAGGRVLDIAFQRRSDRGEIDRAAMSAVKQAAAERVLLRDPRGPVRVRYAVEAAVAVTTILPSPIVDPVSGAVQGATIPLIGLSFDADFKRPKVAHVLKRDVKTRVALLSIEKAD